MDDHKPFLLKDMVRKPTYQKMVVGPPNYIKVWFFIDHLNRVTGVTQPSEVSYTPTTLYEQTVLDFSRVGDVGCPVFFSVETERLMSCRLALPCERSRHRSRWNSRPLEQWPDQLTLIFWVPTKRDEKISKYRGIIYIYIITHQTFWVVVSNISCFYSQLRKWSKFDHFIFNWVETT